MKIQAATYFCFRRSREARSSQTVFTAKMVLKKCLLILRCLHSIALKFCKMLACIVVYSYVNFHAITMDRFFSMIAVSPIKSCFEKRSTLANFERSKSPEDFHTIGTARLQRLINDARIPQHSIQSSNYAHFVPMLIYEKDKFVSILSALTVAVN